MMRKVHPAHPTSVRSLMQRVLSSTRYRDIFGRRRHAGIDVVDKHISFRRCLHPEEIRLWRESRRVRVH